MLKFFKIFILTLFIIFFRQPLVFANDQWVLARPSGTEPVVRIYAESTHPNNTIVLIDAMKRLLNTN